MAIKESQKKPLVLGKAKISENHIKRAEKLGNGAVSGSHILSDLGFTNGANNQNQGTEV